MNTYEDDEYNDREEEEREERFYRNILGLKESYRDSIDFPDIVRELDDRTLGVEKRVFGDEKYRERLRKNFSFVRDISISGLAGAGLLFYGVRKEYDVPAALGLAFILYATIRTMKRMI